MLSLPNTSISIDTLTHERARGRFFQTPFSTISTIQHDLERLSLDDQVHEIPPDDQVRRAPLSFYEHPPLSECIISLCGEDEFFDTDAVLKEEAEYERRELAGEFDRFEYGFGQEICKSEDVALPRHALEPVQYSQDDDYDYDYDHNYDYDNDFDSDSQYGYVSKVENGSNEGDNVEYDDIGDEEQPQEPEFKKSVEYGADVESPTPCSQQDDVRSTKKPFPKVDGKHVRRWRNVIYYYDEELMYDERYLILGDDDIETILNSVVDDDDDDDCNMQAVQM
ncbi:hypothetical protein EDD21DRAFT_370500 [Dissophora ornata]|nr:hypothetical protein EDD21DRAFT_370500 [Dissophora ornata]